MTAADLKSMMLAVIAQQRREPNGEQWILPIEALDVVEDFVSSFYVDQESLSIPQKLRAIAEQLEKSK